MAKAKTKQDKVGAVLAARKKQHGSIADHALCAQELKDAMKRGKNWSELTPVQKEVLEMVQHKIARILSGDPELKDHWVDIGGYARLAEDLANG